VRRHDSSPFRFVARSQCNVEHRERDGERVGGGWAVGGMDGWVNGTAASIFPLASYCCYLLRRQRHISPLSFSRALFRFGICSIFVNISVPVYESSFRFSFSGLSLCVWPRLLVLFIVVVVVADVRCGGATAAQYRCLFLLTPLIILFASVRSKILDSLFFLPPHREKIYLT